MAKARIEYVCRECGAKAARWSGRCPECQAWNTLDERAVRVTASAGPSARLRVAVAAGPGGGGARRPLRLDEIDVADFDRLAVGIEEFGRVLGGGIVPG